MTVQMQMLQLASELSKQRQFIITVATQPCKFVPAVKYGTVKNIAFASCLLDICKRTFAY